MLRIEKLVLRNYKRIYNGLGVKRLELDFNDKDIIRLIGNNGTGKSTILNALTPFPEPPSEYMPNGTSGGKELFIRDDNIMYQINYYYNGINNVASIKKYPVNHEDLAEELVPSGNVSSAKEIIYSLFNLDANFKTLTMMNGYDKKSLAHMRPSERKIFITSLLNNLGTYNAMYKTLCKRSSIFKAMINDINAKIINIGDSPDRISLQITNLNNQIDELNKKKEEIVKKLAVIDLTDEEIALNQKTKTKIEETVNLVEFLKTYIANVEKEWTETFDALEYFNYPLLKKNIREMSIEDFSELYNHVQSTILTLKNDIESFTKEKVSYIEQRKMLDDKRRFIQASKDFIEFGKFKEDFSKLDIAKVQDIILQFATKYPDFTDQDVKFILNDIDFNLFIVQFQRLLVERAMLYDIKINHNIHTHCVIDQDYNYDQQKVLDYKRGLYDEMMLHPNKSDSIIEALETIDLSIMNIGELKRRKDIDIKLWNLMHDYNVGSRDVIMKYLGISFIERLEYNGSFDVEKAKALYDDVLLYNTYRQYIEKQKQYEEGEEGKTIREMLSKLEEVKKDISNLTEHIHVLDSTINAKTEVLKVNEDNLVHFKTLKDLIYKYDRSTKRLSNVEMELDKLKLSYVDVTDCSYYKNELNNINQLIKQSQDELYRYRYSLDLINEYMIELDDFQGKHKYVETVKKYCSPSTGIQIIFIDLYMNQILKTANYILKNLFGGEFILQPFVINENEFRIPVQGDGLLIDDISSMSASQIAMINMAVSFAILENTSSKYKIIRLDEIDSPLDNNNRAAYPQLISMIMQILGSSQCFIVSHNEEFNNQDFKTINLQKGVKEYK